MIVIRCVGPVRGGLLTAAALLSRRRWGANPAHHQRRQSDPGLVDMGRTVAEPVQTFGVAFVRPTVAMGGLRSSA